MDRPAFRYRFGSAEFDESRFELRVAGLPVDVERRALEVLAYLLRHAGEVVTKDELLREVWAGRITVDKVLPNAINKLRRALGEANASHVATHARVGYRLDGTVTRIAVGRQPDSTLALAAGQPVPGRPNFTLLRALGRTAGSEVWLAAQPKTHEQRVYKFGLDADRLRALKREATLLRLLHDSVADAGAFVEVLDWNFEAQPYFLECRYGGVSLEAWAQAHLAALARPARIALFLQIADAVAAAHAVGVLHKDLKPANVLVAGDAAAPQVRLTDFGSGHLLEPDRLAQLGITRLGMTVEDGAGGSASSGTPLYIAPELFEGEAPTVQSDVFALGILLYQLLAGRIGLPMAPGWEAQIGDDLLCEDLQRATDGNRERRLGSAAELAERLRRLDARRAERQALAAAQEAARRDREALARAQARRPFVWALVGVLVLGIGVSLVQQRQATDARNEAQRALDRATALTRFLNEDLIGRSNPLVSAKGPDATLREVLLSARERVPARFASQPDTGAAVHGSLASLFNAVDLFKEAEAEARRAIELQGRGGAPAAEARMVLVRALSRQGRFDDARAELDVLERLATQAADPRVNQRVAAARASYLIGRGEFPKAADALRAALDGLDPADPADAAQRDVLRLDLVTTLALANRDEQALAEGRALIDDVRARPGDQALLLALAQLALVRAQGEDHAAAEQLLLQARPVIAARLGENHSRHITLLGELLGVAFRQGDWPRATGYAQQVHERARAKYGDAHVLTYVTLNNWARTLNEAGRPRDALDKAEAAHAQLLRLAGAASAQTQDAAFVLALVLLQLGDTARADALVNGLDAAVLEAGRPNGVWAAGIEALRGISLQRRGQAGAARPLLESALAALKEEETLAQPSRLFVVLKDARERLP